MVPRVPRPVTLKPLTEEHSAARRLRGLLAPPPIDEPLRRLQGERLLVTGALGSIGLAAGDVLSEAGIDLHATDLLTENGSEPLDVRSPEALDRAMATYRPGLVLHLAGAKSAPAAETDVMGAHETNAAGTANVVASAVRAGARVITASTCKACDPETVYGATKLLSERMTIAAGGSVARFYNVIESSGNVFELWRAVPADQPLPVTPCSRYFITLADATALLLWAAVLPPGRYTVDPGKPRRIADVASQLYPGRAQRPIPPRRGDRVDEPLCALSETIEPVSGRIQRIVNRHDSRGGNRVSPTYPLLNR
jgi:FlaA1/EpsC-like NDP-sugar epimerase